MPRHAEVVRQWKILLELEASRRSTIDRLAEMCRVSTRTIRRDLNALQEAGFPLYDERAEGRVFWKLTGHPFRVLSEMGFTISELSAFYFSRAIVEAIACAPFAADLKSGIDKLAGVLTPRMQAFLDKLPDLLVAKDEPGRPRAAGAEPKTVGRLMDALTSQRRVKMTYHSFSSRRVKDYLVEPYRLAYGQGALYLFAYVPEYMQMRTFAVGRIKNLNVLEERFSPVGAASERPFANSLGVHSGKPVAVEIEFAPSVAPYIREREWHHSQKIREGQDGAIVLSLKVSTDRALESWILSFGPFARVLKPAKLSEQILDEIEETREQYIPRMSFESPQPLYDASMQPTFHWGHDGGSRC
ncbi:MAG: WYL domain-containing protein [Acidobacteria bacterium]|nr:MAG: WYL domain-containing protein [Acidobacteriota bacterium]